MQSTGGDELAADTDTLTERDKMWGGEKDGRLCGGTQHGIGKGADRSFSIGSGNVQDALSLNPLFQAKRFHKTLGIFQSQLHAEHLGAVEPG